MPVPVPLWASRAFRHVNIIKLCTNKSNHGVRCKEQTARIHQSTNTHVSICLKPARRPLAPTFLSGKQPPAVAIVQPKFNKQEPKKATGNQIKSKREKKILCMAKVQRNLHSGRSECNHNSHLEIRAQDTYTDTFTGTDTATDTYISVVGSDARGLQLASSFWAFDVALATTTPTKMFCEVRRRRN